MRDNYPCLPLVQERFWNEIKDKEEYKELKYYPDFEVCVFPQTWGDTSLGFGGVGGQAITTAYTTVIQDVNTGWCGVFFGERMAYTILNPNDKFYKDMQSFNIEPVSKRGLYRRNEE